MLTLSSLKNVFSEFETRFGSRPTDTHFFASGSGINVLNRLCDKPSRRSEPTVEILTMESLCGMQIWHDPAVPANEIEMGRIEIRNGKPHKVVTKVFTIAA